MASKTRTSSPQSGTITDAVASDDIGMNRNLCELIEVANYWMQGTHQDWLTLEIYLNDLPEGFSFAVVNGVESTIRYAERLNFESPGLPGSIEYFKSLSCFSHIPDTFFDDYLINLRFTGDIYSLPEGTVILPGSLILSIHAQRGQLELLEGHILGLLNIQILHTTVAAKVRLAAGSHRYLIEYGFTEPPSSESVLESARACYIGGFNGTTNLLAAYHHSEIPLFDLIPKPIHQHKTIPLQANAYKCNDYTQKLKAFPNNMVCIRSLEEAEAVVDSLDTLASCEALEEEFGKGFDRRHFSGFCLEGIEEDELSDVTLKLRRLLISKGLQQAGIVLAGPFEERVIQQLEDLFQNPPESSKHPENLFPENLGEIYYGVCPHHLSYGKTLNFTCRILSCEAPESEFASQCDLKQVYRFFDSDGRWSRDHLQPFEIEPPMAGIPMMQPILNRGQRLDEPQSLDLIRTRTWANIHSLREEVLYANPKKENDRKLVSPR